MAEECGGGIESVCIRVMLRSEDDEEKPEELPREGVLSDVCKKLDIDDGEDIVLEVVISAQPVPLPGDVVEKVETSEELMSCFDAFNEGGGESEGRVMFLQLMAALFQLEEGKHLKATGRGTLVIEVGGEEEEKGSAEITGSKPYDEETSTYHGLVEVDGSASALTIIGVTINNAGEYGCGAIVTGGGRLVSQVSNFVNCEGVSIIPVPF